MLITNKTLRKLELEGNKIGEKSIFAFGKALEVNKTLRLLDLESNDIYKSTKNVYDNESKTIGKVHNIFSFIESLKKNKTLLSLNLANNGLPEEVGKEFVVATQVN